MPKANEAHRVVVECLTEALLQMMEKKPFELITVSELCKKAGVSRVSFYRNFDSMQDILKSYLSACTDKWWQEFEKKSEEEFHATFWNELLDQYKKNEKLIKLLDSNHVLYILRDHIHSCCGPTDADDDEAAYIRAMIAGMIYGLVSEWIHRGMCELPCAPNLRRMLELVDDTRSGDNASEGEL